MVGMEGPRPAVLFGTSGIRGRAYPSWRPGWHDAAARGDGLCPGLAFALGVALGRHLPEGKPFHLGCDTRATGEALTEALARGLAHEGREVRMLGVTPTPTHVLYAPLPVIMVTASHNPPTDNGIKVFFRGEPIPRAFEELLESELAALSIEIPDGLPANIPPAATLDHRASHAAKVLAWARTEAARADLGDLGGRVLCFDPARGAMAGQMCADGFHPGPHLEALLELGVTVIAFAWERSADHVNERCGAAYCYGETDAAPDARALRAFLQGRSGHGGMRRLMLVPSGQAGWVVPGKGWEPVAVRTGRPVSGWLLDDDVDPGMAPEQFLPALLVDGDGDRILLAAGDVPGDGPPFLSGDMLLRVLLETSAPGSLPSLLWTCESGLGIEKHVEARNSASPVAIVRPSIVNVGDRNIVARMFEAGEDGAIGGEPSGHVMLGRRVAGGYAVIDDPLAVYLRVLSGLKGAGLRLGPVLERMLAAVPEVPCVRKPDAWGPNGALTPGMKKSLECSRINEGVWSLTPYANLAIPFLAGELARLLTEFFHPEGLPRLTWSEDWQRLAAGETWPAGHTSEREVALCGPYTFTIRTTGELVFGPDVIHVSVLAGGSAGPVKVAEAVQRNSGTRPKNGAYLKCWYRDPVSGRQVSMATLESGLREFAERRAEFTNRALSRLEESLL